MAKFEGVVSYERLPNGCLNGVFSNTHPDTKNKIFNEIAKKKSPHDETDAIIEGEYNCCYMDEKELYMRDLKITPNNGRYDLTWTNQENNEIVFEGFGWQTRNNELTVIYWWEE
jgi:hypothetical protein